MATTVQQSVITMATEILRAAGRVVVWDYPGKEIPGALTRAGLSVTIYLAYLDTPDILKAARELGRTSRRRPRARSQEPIPPSHPSAGGSFTGTFGIDRRRGSSSSGLVSFDCGARFVVEGRPLHRHRGEPR